MFSNPRQVAPKGIEPGAYRTISESLYQCATLPQTYGCKKTSVDQTLDAHHVHNHYIKEKKYEI